MKSYRVVMICADKSEVVVAHGLTHNEATIECARMNRENNNRKVHYIVR